MSNKIKLQEHATDLQAILDTINALPRPVRMLMR